MKKSKTLIAMAIASMLIGSCKKEVCVPPTTFNIPSSNESSVMSQYQDSLVSGPIKMFFYKYFSPNGDAQMDLCETYSQQKDSITSFHLTITDFCSKKFFETTDLYSKWDGTYQGKPVSKGIYKRSLSVILVNGQTLAKTDSVQLIRY